MTPIQFGQRVAEILPQRLPQRSAEVASVEVSAPQDQCEVRTTPGPVAWLSQLAQVQASMGGQGCSMLVDIAQQVGRELVTTKQESLWASRTAFEYSTYNSQINGRLDSICGKLAGVSTLKDLRLQPILEEKTTYNAKASGAGLINITEGLVGLLDDASQGKLPEQDPQRALTAQVGDYLSKHQVDSENVLAAILAHEVAHIEHRDVAAARGQQLLSEQLGYCATQGEGAARGLLMELPEALQNANWEMEFRADKRGQKLLDKAGFPPESMGHALNILSLIEKAMGKPTTDHDHPPLAERLTRLQQNELGS